MTAVNYLTLAKQAIARLKPTEVDLSLPSLNSPLTFSEAVARVLPMPLDQFEREGIPLKIKVSWHSTPLWFVPQESDAEALVRDGVNRGLVWTAKELLDLLAIPSLTREQVRTIALAKAEFLGEIVEVRNKRIKRDKGESA